MHCAECFDYILSYKSDPTIRYTLIYSKGLPIEYYEDMIRFVF